MTLSTPLWILGTLGRHLLALFAATLPRRVWRAWDGVLPIRRMAVPSALVAVLSGVLTGFHGFLDYADDLSRRNAAAMLRVAEAQASAQASGQPDVGLAAPVAFSMLAVFFFALTTPAGILATYLSLSGIFRAVIPIADEPSGDPLLTGLDAWLQRSGRRISNARAASRREHLEGPEVPDLLHPAAWARLAGADFVLVASRTKPGWEAGVIIASGERWLRIGEPADRYIAGRLRTLYPLTEVKDVEALRRWVLYDLPPLSEGPSGR